MEPSHACSCPESTRPIPLSVRTAQPEFFPMHAKVGEGKRAGLVQERESGKDELHTWSKAQSETPRQFSEL